MATTLTLQDSINFAAPFLKNTPLQVSNQQPALRAGNIILGSILGPPMRWRFNRFQISFPITGAATDYVQLVNNFGFLEEAWLLNGAGDQKILKGALSLSKNPQPGRPDFIAPQFDDNAGNITFRVDKLPDENYTVWITYQGKAPLLTSAASPWGSVPDEFSYIFDYGFLCIMSLLVNDSRFPIFENYFLGRLLGAQDGLTDQARDVFLGNWANTMATVKRADGSVSSGVAGRAR